jgi:hypothetical protein
VGLITCSNTRFPKQRQSTFKRSGAYFSNITKNTCLIKPCFIPGSVKCSMISGVSGAQW